MRLSSVTGAVRPEGAEEGAETEMGTKTERDGMRAV